MRQQQSETKERARRAPIAFGPFRLDPDDARLVDGAGKPVALTPKALDVLHYLASRPDRLVTKDELLSAVWPDVIVGDASIKVCVREIRQALRDDVKTPQYIETVHRRGYRFIAKVDDGEVAGRGGRMPVPPSAPPPTAAPVPPAPPAAMAGTARDGSSLEPAPPPSFVGRELEMRRLRELFARAAVTAQRQLVFITSGPGGGKSTLVEAFLAEVARLPVREGPGARVLVGHCFEQFGTSEPYMPVWEALGRLTRERQSLAITALMARHADLVVRGGNFDAPPGAIRPPGDPDAATRAVSEPRSMADRVLREMADGIEALAAEAPVVLVLEDVQWADYSTLDLISALARRRSSARLFVVATYRPAEVLVDEHPLREVANELMTGRLCCEMPLELLDQDAVARYLAGRFPRGQLPAALAERLHQRTDGHPLFLAHLVDDLIEQGVFLHTEAEGGWRIAAAGDDAGPDAAAGAWLAVLDTHIPQTVRAMIELHLDRLTDAERAAIHAAAVAGIEFSAAEVAVLTAADGPAARADNAAVVRAEHACEELARRHRMLRPHGLAEWPDGTVATHYRFAHELYHHVVYDRIPAARRAMMHRTLGLALENAWGARAREEAAELAMHFEQGREWARAVTHLRHAADAAGRQYAHREAVSYLRRALAAIERLPADARAAHELDVLMALGVNLQVTRGFAAPEVREIHARADALCRRTGTAAPSQDVAATFPVLWGIWLFHKVRSDLRQAAEMADRLLALARESGEDTLLLQAHQAMCVTHLCLGSFDVTRDHMEQAAALYDPARHANNTQLYGQDPGVSTLSFGALALWFLGRVDEALAAHARAMDLARRLGQPSSLALAQHFAAMLHQCRGDADAVARAAEDVIDVAAEEGFSFWHAGGTILRGWARATRGEADGIDEARHGLRA